MERACKKVLLSADARKPAKKLRARPADRYWSIWHTACNLHNRAERGRGVRGNRNFAEPRPAD